MDVIWSGVIAINGPFFFAIILCIIIACLSELKQQRRDSEVAVMTRRNIKMRRSCSFDYTANLVTMTQSNGDSHLIDSRRSS